MNQQLSFSGVGVNFPGKFFIPGPEVFLPMDRNKTSRSASRRTNGSLKTARKKRRRILIVDDERRFREAMAFYITELFDIQVDIAESGYDAIDYLKGKNLYEAIFLDIKMSGMDGVETYREMQKMKVACPIIMMSAYADSEKWEEAKQLGAELISKPIPENVLAEILKNISR